MFQCLGTARACFNSSGTARACFSVYGTARAWSFETDRVCSSFFDTARASFNSFWTARACFIVFGTPRAWPFETARACSSFFETARACSSVFKTASEWSFRNSKNMFLHLWGLSYSDYGMLFVSTQTKSLGLYDASSSPDSNAPKKSPLAQLKPEKTSN